MEDEREELLDALGETSELDEIDRLDPVPDVIELRCGIKANVQRLRFRQVMKLLKIVTHGAGRTLMSADIDFRDDPALFAQKMLGVIMYAIPDAEQESVEFIASVLEPVGLTDKAPRDLSDGEREENVRLWTELNTEIFNPDPFDTVDILENVIRREAEDLQALGKRLSQFMKLAQKMGLLRGQQAQNSQASSPASTTSSATSTAGATSTSAASGSAGSGKSSSRSRSGNGRRRSAAAS